jgi:hypothetical protein
MDKPWFLGPNALLMKARGCPFCIRTAPTPLAEASVSMAKGLEKSGSAGTGAVDITVFKALNVVSWSCVQINITFFFDRSVRGLAKIPKCHTNLQ